MSYARFSSDDFRSDVYVYADVAGGWTTWVAASRHTLTDDQLPPDVDTSDGTEGSWLRWYRRHQVVMRLLKDAPMVDIGLPMDGAKLTADSPGHCADQLEHLRNLGYNVPQDAVDRLREEEDEALLASFYASEQYKESPAERLARELAEDE